MEISKQLKSMKKGESKPFQVTHPREMKSIQSACSYANRFCPELNMMFKTQMFYDRNIIVVTAHGKGE
jgi:Pyruvate/2-oxoacid:ferredoxin oxidoreductase delta subunit